MQQTIFTLERKRIFDAALDLIKDGRFYTASISEISYHANLTEGTTRLLFESKEHIVAELYDYASNRLQEIINQLTAADRSFENDFVGVWVGLYEHCVLDSRMLTFFEHHQSQLFLNAKVAQRSKLLEPLIYIVTNRDEINGMLLRPETIVHFLCASVVTHAKLHLDSGTKYNRKEAINIARAWSRSLQYETAESSMSSLNRT